MSVERLTQRVQERRNWREQDRLQEEQRTARQKEIDAAPDRKVTDFWCEKCDNDYIALGFKHVCMAYDVDKRASYTPENGFRAWYVGECECGEDNIRRITDQVHDSYYKLSRNVLIDRRKHKEDIEKRYEQPEFQT